MYFRTVFEVTIHYNNVHSYKYSFPYLAIAWLGEIAIFMDSLKEQVPLSEVWHTPHLVKEWVNLFPKWGDIT